MSIEQIRDEIQLLNRKEMEYEEYFITGEGSTVFTTEDAKRRKELQERLNWLEWQASNN